MTDVERCACGLPLHYTDPFAQREVERLIELLGPLVPITIGSNGRTWLVPRHYIALHGIVAAELPALAARYGFKEIAGRD